MVVAAEILWATNDPIPRQLIRSSHVLYTRGPSGAQNIVTRNSNDSFVGFVNIRTERNKLIQKKLTLDNWILKNPFSMVSHCSETTVPTTNESPGLMAVKELNDDQALTPSLLLKNIL